MSIEKKIPIHAEKANDFIDHILTELRLKNDAALARLMEVAPPVVSKMRHGRIPVGCSYIIRWHEMTGWPISYIKECLGLPTWKPHQDNQLAGEAA